jgi:hypothetical protein
MNTKSGAVVSATARGSVNLPTAQFFTVMVSGWTFCAKLTGIKAMASTDAAPRDSSDRRFENSERRYSERIAAVSNSLNALSPVPSSFAIFRELLLIIFFGY